MADTETKEPETPPGPENTDDARASAAARNRKRAEKDWEEKKKLWRQMGVPKGLPAKK
jgi:hypothetical protein